MKIKELTGKLHDLSLSKEKGDKAVKKDGRTITKTTDYPFLNKDLLVHVMSFLPAKDYVAFIKTCRAIYGIKGEKLRDSDVLAKIVKQSKGSITQLLNSSWESDFREFGSKNLQSLDLRKQEHVSFEELQHLCTCFPNLSKLQLQLTAINTIPPSSTLNQIDGVSLSCQNVSEEELVNLAILFPNLKQLHLAGTLDSNSNSESVNKLKYLTNFEGLRALVHFTKLEELHLCIEILTPDVQNILQSLKGIQRLSLFVKNLSPANMRSMRLFPNLQELVCLQGNDLEDRDVQSLTTSCQGLRKLVLMGAVQLTPHIFQYLSLLKELEELSLLGGDTVSYYGSEFLQLQDLPKLWKVETNWGVLITRDLAQESSPTWIADGFPPTVTERIVGKILSISNLVLKTIFRK